MFEYVRVVRCKKCGRIWFSGKSYMKKYKGKCRFCGGKLEETWITKDEYEWAVYKKLVIVRKK